MDIKSLKTFVSVVNNKNFSAAARELHTVQPTVSRHISELEAKLGVKLFHRNTHQVELTEAGAIFFPEAFKIIANNKRVIELVNHAGNQKVATLNVGYLATASSFFLPDIIKSFAVSQPETTINLYEMSGKQQYDAITENKVDVIFCREQPLLADPRFSCVEVYSDSLVAVVPRCHPLAEEKEISIYDLRNDKFMMFHQTVWSDVFKHIVQLCKEYGFTPQMTYSPENMRHMATFVSSGLGVSIAPSCIQFVADKYCVCIPIKEMTLTMPLYMYTNKGNESDEVLSFVALCQKNRDHIRAMLS